MIHVEKNLQNIPNSLVNAGAKELEKAKQQLKDTGKVSVDFKAYREPDVKDELEKTFHKKCAYCESKFMATSPGAVEHFRPKGINRRIYKTPRQEYQGYYWLAAKWENLLLSCTDCNSSRGHLVKGETKKKNMGKQDQFPLTDENVRCFHHDHDTKQEKNAMLLINPCEEKDPRIFFDFTVEGEISVNKKLSDFDKDRSQTSIDVYALRRIDLSLARQTYYLKNIADKLTDIEEYKEELNSLPPGDQKGIDRKNAQINRKVRDLTDLCYPEQPYSAMAYQIVKKKLMEALQIDVDKLIKK